MAFAHSIGVLCLFRPARYLVIVVVGRRGVVLAVPEENGTVHARPALRRRGDRVRLAAVRCTL